MKKKLYIKTYGCQMNVYDSQKMSELLSPIGFEIKETPDDADMVILNTCHIREKSEQKLFSDLGRLRPFKEQKKEKGEHMVIAVAGCVAQAEGAEILRLAPYVDMVVGPQSYHRLPEMVVKIMRNVGKHEKVVNIDFPIESKFDSLPLSDSTESAAFLAIQEGCDKFCAYCVVPYTRGSEYSRSVKEVLKEARHLVNLGAVELTLLGQNVNAYHGTTDHKEKEWSLGRLLHALSDIDGLKRIRYMTSHPRDVDVDLIHAHRDIDKLMPYLHLPIQSGSNRVLSEMNRQHTRDTYLLIIEQFRKARPDMAFSSDFIVGFPGETDKDFEDTLDLVRQVGYAQAYSFKFSARPGTPASAMESQIPEPEKDARLQSLQELLNEQQLNFNKSKVGSTQTILLERKGKHTGQLIGRSPYMQSVVVLAQERLLGSLVKVKIESAHGNSLSGTILSKEREDLRIAV